MFVLATAISLLLIKSKKVVFLYSDSVPQIDFIIRLGKLDDLDILFDLENKSFEIDRLTRRQLKYLLTKANARTFIAESTKQELLGYITVLFSRGTAVARLYSLAIEDNFRKMGIGTSLVKKAEDAAWEHDRAYVRIEIHPKDEASINLFEKLGYRKFGILSDYYEDHTEALRFEKTLTPGLIAQLDRVPFYEQTLDFTCGPSALMMAMKALTPEMVLNRKLELRIWREATTVFMTSGHGGCGPLGLALAAFHRGYGVELFISDPGVPLLDSVRSQEKKEVVRLVHEDMLEEAEAAKISIHYGILNFENLSQRIDEGAIPLVLISSYRIYEEKFPHWVVVTGHDDHFIYCNDPLVDYDNGETTVDSINMPIPIKDFSKMGRYGRAGLQAVIFVSMR